VPVKKVDLMKTMKIKGYFLEVTFPWQPLCLSVWHLHYKQLAHTGCMLNAEGSRTACKFNTLLWIHNQCTYLPPLPGRDITHTRRTPWRIKLNELSSLNCGHGGCSITVVSGVYIVGRGEIPWIRDNNVGTVVVIVTRSMWPSVTDPHKEPTKRLMETWCRNHHENHSLWRHLVISSH
jgi:hypothetical protein